MDTLGWLEAVPIGIVFFGGTVFAVLRRKAGKGLARREYPHLARRWGLTLEPPRYAGWIGKLVGRVQGRQVLVDPDESSRVSVAFLQPLSIDVRSYERWKRCPAGFEPFSLGREWDGWLTNRYCAVGAADTLHMNAALMECLSALRRAAQRPSQLTIDADKVEVVMDFGTPGHVPARVVDLLLPALIRTASTLEALVTRSDSGSAPGLPHQV